MKREDVLRRLGFVVPENKVKRVIICADIAAEADDQVAIVHHLLTPTENVVGIIAGNFEWRYRTIPSLTSQRLKSMERSYQEGQKLLKLMEIDDVPLLRGAPDCISNPDSIPVSDGSRFIVEEAMRESEEPLYIALQGSLTDLAVAYLAEPRIAEKIEAAIWIGGAKYPEGGRESNLQQDIYAAQILFDSPMNIWQIPSHIYGGMYLSFAELMINVRPCGVLGEYLADNMFRVNDWYGHAPRGIAFPHGEVWSIGDQPTISVLLQSDSGSRYHMEQAPKIQPDMTYKDNPEGKWIRVYDAIDTRLTIEDLFAKLRLCYGKSSNEMES